MSGTSGGAEQSSNSLILTKPPAPHEIDTDERVYLHPDSDLPCYRDDDGVEWEWNELARSWFPVITQTALLAQQETYSAAYPEVESSAREKTTTNRAEDSGSDGEGGRRKRKVRAKRKVASASLPTEKPVTAIYISRLPCDATEEELKLVFSRYGVIAEDPVTGKPRIKIYHDAQGRPKGDALITYLKPESVSLAVDMMDEAPLRPAVTGKKEEPITISVSKAVFNQKKSQSVRPATQQMSLKERQAVKAKRAKLEKKLEWQPEDDEGERVKEQKASEKLRRCVVLKFMFTLAEIAADPTLLIDLKQDVREECEKFGPITSLVIYDLEEDGVILVRFRELMSSEICIEKLNGRFFAGRRIEAEYFNGQKFRQSSRTEEDDEARLLAYEKWLNED